MGGVSVASVGNKELGNWSWLGFGLCMLGTLSYAFYMVGSQLVLQDSGISINPVSAIHTYVRTTTSTSSATTATILRIHHHYHSL